MNSEKALTPNQRRHLLKQTKADIVDEYDRKVKTIQRLEASRVALETDLRTAVREHDDVVKRNEQIDEDRARLHRILYKINEHLNAAIVMHFPEIDQFATQHPVKVDDPITRLVMRLTDLSDVPETHFGNNESELERAFRRRY